MIKGDDIISQSCRKNNEFKSMRTLVKKTDALQLEMNHLYALLISFNEYLDSLPQFDPETIDMEINNGLKAINSLLGFQVVLGCLIIELSEIEEKIAKFVITVNG